MCRETAANTYSCGADGLGPIVTQKGCSFEAKIEGPRSKVCTTLCMNPDFSPAEPEIECYGDGGPCESTAEGGWKIPEGETTCVYPELGGADCAGVTAVVMMKDGELSDRLGSSVPVLCGLENGYGEICSQQ